MPQIKPLALVVITLLSSAVYAQTPEENSDVVLDTIVVTAQRRAERIIDVPALCR